MYVPSAITLIKLYASFGDAAATAGITYTIGIRDNGATVMSCSIVGPTTDFACTASGPVSVAAGHFIQAQFSAVGVGATGQQPKVALTFQ